MKHQYLVICGVSGVLSLYSPWCLVLAVAAVLVQGGIESISHLQTKNNIAEQLKEVQAEVASLKNKISMLTKGRV